MPEMSPDMLRRFAQIAMSTGSQEEAFQTFLGVLKESGVGQSAIDEAQAIGPKLLKKSTLPRSVKALTGGLKMSQFADQAFDVARQTTQGIPDHIITTAWRREIQKSGGPLAARLKGVPSDVVLRAVRGGTFTGGPAAAAGVQAAEVVGGGALATIPKVAEAGAGAAVKTAAKGVTRKLAGAGFGLGLGLLLPFGSRSPVSLVGQEGRARDRAVMGFSAMGKTSSGDVMSAVVRQQDLAARRQVVLQTFEPELFQQMLTSLALNEQPPTSITSTERRIGGAYEQSSPARRPDKDVKFLMDQLMSEMSGNL